MLVWGGDGTVRRCIQTLIDDDLDASIGILPAGTGNLLANNLGIPIEVRGRSTWRCTASRARSTSG